jgi:hypothetical protein
MVTDRRRRGAHAPPFVPDAAQANGHTECDLTQNGSVNYNDACAALMCACGEISDLDAFAERLSTGLLGREVFRPFLLCGRV